MATPLCWAEQPGWPRSPHHDHVHNAVQCLKHTSGVATGSVCSSLLATSGGLASAGLLAPEAGLADVAWAGAPAPLVLSAAQFLLYLWLQAWVGVAVAQKVDSAGGVKV